MEAINESLHPPMEIGYARLVSTSAITWQTVILNRQRRTACLPVAVASVAFVPQQLGISVLSWREDQRISQANCF